MVGGGGCRLDARSAQADASQSPTFTPLIKIMTTTIQDIKGGESVCCGAELYNDDICSDCKEHSEQVKYSCEQCKDTGFITKTEWTDSDTSYDVEVRCNCQED